MVDFLNPGFLGNHTDFRRRFLLPIQKRADSGAALQLRKLTAPFILRRLKTDTSVIEDLPAKMEMKVFCNLTPTASLSERHRRRRWMRHRASNAKASSSRH